MKEIRVKQTNLKTDGNFWLLDGQPYSGEYHIWTDGKAMTESRFNGGKSKELKISPTARNIVEYDLLTEKHREVDNMLCRKGLYLQNQIMKMEAL
jgi:hypothetical protein